MVKIGDKNGAQKSDEYAEVTNEPDPTVYWFFFHASRYMRSSDLNSRMYLSVAIISS